jgi:hypothetical protein
MSCDGTVCHADGVVCRGGSGVDAAVDVPVAPDDSTDGASQLCVQSNMLPQICVPLPVRGTYIGVAHLDTNVATNCDATVQRTSETELCVIAANTVTISTPMHVSGARPFVLISFGSMSIDHTLDADSHFQEPGAGGTSTCLSAAQGADAAAVGGVAGSGGAGGTFGTAGGAGGNSDGVAGGTVQLGPDPLVFHAGQNGGSGGNGPAGTGAGPCGLGGGALYLYAKGALTVNAAVTAFGFPGDGGSAGFGGGGGGGSGGMIIIASPTSTTLPSSSVVAATGAGGGAGGSAAGAGGRGNSPIVSAAAAPAQGGTPNGSAGGGGRGSTGPCNMCSDAFPGGDGVGEGGGGGGGGAGLIYIYPANATEAGVIYPPPS